MWQAEVSTKEGVLRSSGWRAVPVVLCAGALLGATPAAGPEPLGAVYHEGELVRIEVAEGGRPFRLGPWRIGARVTDPKPKDQRLNLYLVAPGKQYQLDGQDEFDHNAVVNALPAPGGTREYDVYWAIVLDPRLRADIKHERDLLLAAQASFTPGDLLEFDDLPGHPFLRQFLKIDSLPGLQKFRRADNRLPRLILVPAGLVLAVTLPEPPAAKSEAAN